MIFDGTMGLDTNRLSLAKVLCQSWGGVLAGASLVLALSFFVVGALRAAKPQAAAEFDRDVKPILQSSCIACHGPDRHEGQLRLDSEGAVLRGGASGKMVIPGNSKESLLIQRLTGVGGGPRMPLGGDPVPAEKIALIRAWIDQGSFASVPAEGSPPQAPSQGTPGSVVFATQVRPIFASRCYPCHGPDVQQHGLRLDSLGAILTGSANGKVVIPGDSEKSHIVRRLRGLEEPQMPYGGPPLSAEQIDLIRKWVDEGAPGPDISEPVVSAAVPSKDVKLSHNVSGKPVDFNREIRPILSDVCFTCHGPEEKSRQGNLRLDSKESVFAERNAYRIITPGSSVTSRLYQKISSKDEASRMPPVWSGKSLTPKQIELLRQWIDQGAKWQSHWAFDPPKRPARPGVKDKSWPKNPIDSFTLARLEAEGLKPSPEADKATLLRRVSLDLTGLPPTPAEVDSFVADRSPDAYEKRVDHLLQSPHYGERMAMPWLDLARYSDTHGFHIDSLREMWPWRDWVISAFNRNMPFDEFTTEQLAGDLLPNATLDQKIASGFNRNHMINFEGGAIPEEYHVEYVVDRVSTTATTWLGLTMGCARCHDHKYDPIKQKDFYRFFAFFNTVPEQGLDGYEGNAVPVLSLPSAEQQRKMDDLNGQIATVLAAMPEKDVLVARNEWQKTRIATPPEPPQDSLATHYAFNGDLKDAFSRQDGKLVRGEVNYEDGPTGKAAEFRGETEVSLGQAGDFDWHKSFAIGAWVNFGELSGQVLQKRDASDHWTGYELGFDDVVYKGRHQRNLRLVVRLAARWPDTAIEMRSKDRVPMDGAHHVLVNYDGSAKAAGVKIFVDGRPWDTEIIRDALSGSFHNSASLEIGNKNTGGVFRGQLGDLRIYTRTLTNDEVENLAVHLPARILLTKLAGTPAVEIATLQPDKPPQQADIGELDKAESKEQKQTRLEKQDQARLSEYFMKHAAPEKYRQLYSQLEDLRKERNKLEKSIITTMVMAEMSKPRDTFILGRGQYDNKGEKVTPGVPSFLPPMSQDLPVNRLGLAKWILDSSNPLTARVAVNQYWQQYFGTGIVKTVEDFGSQGEPPSHPGLLDWLATEFVQSGWNIKAVQRLIVTSATYRQSSRASRELIEHDPENRLLARGPRFRLPAEMVRDNALAISGLLNDKIGGPSAYPYQPEGLWEEMAFGQGFSGQTYTQSSNSDLYRRGMYTVWKRTVPPPSLTIFDAPDREKCTARRAVTNTPLQALVLLNDPTYVEAARAFAQRVLHCGGRTDRERLNFAFKLATARTPDSQERVVLLGSLREFRSSYQQDQEYASKLLSVGDVKADSRLDPRELAAWTTLAGMILNLDETITAE
jgi:mono/diheme cytochrome c family protein